MCFTKIDLRTREAGRASGKLAMTAKVQERLSCGFKGEWEKNAKEFAKEGAPWYSGSLTILQPLVMWNTKRLKEELFGFLRSVLRGKRRSRTFYG